MRIDQLTDNYARRIRNALCIGAVTLAGCYSSPERLRDLQHMLQAPAETTSHRAERLENARVLYNSIDPTDLNAAQGLQYLEHGRQISAMMHDNTQESYRQTIRALESMDLETQSLLDSLERLGDALSPADVSPVSSRTQRSP